MVNFADKLCDAISVKGNPCVVGLDFHPTLLPEFVRQRLHDTPTEQGYGTIIKDFLCRVVDSVESVVPVIKPQVSLLERFRCGGADALNGVIKHARDCGLLVIADAKRNDIASSAEGYVAAFLAIEESDPLLPGYDADALTVNGYLGRDSLEPFRRACMKYGKGMFVLVKTSNKGSVETQDVRMNDGEAYYTVIARMVDELGRELVGSSGFSPIGAVVGATFPQQAQELRKLMPRALILVPGYGAQGASADDVCASFTSDGRGAIVNASRSVVYDVGASGSDPKSYETRVRENALRMVEDINSALGKHCSTA